MKQKLILTLLSILVAFATPQKMIAQNIKIVTGHPDFKMEVLRCSSSSNNLIIELIITNLSDDDIEEIYAYGGGWNGGTKIYDNLGNIYDGDNLEVKVANKNFTSTDQRFKLVNHLPTKVTYSLKGFSSRATSITLFEPDFNIPEWSVKRGTFKIRNITISR